MSKITLGDIRNFFPNVPAFHFSSAVLQIEVEGITHDSRELKPGFIFVCIRGAKADGHRMLQEAKSRGAIAALIEVGAEVDPSIELPCLEFPDTRLALAQVAQLYFQDPSANLCMVAVTGTNGKTSTSWAIAQILGRLGISSAYGGTFGLAAPTLLLSEEGDQYEQLSRFFQATTASPDPLVLQSFLREILKSGGKAAALEATSQGIAQKRTRGVHWDAAVFTNLTRDHLDLHGTMENYFQAKLQLFSKELAGSQKHERVAVVNADDEYGRRILAELSSYPNILSTSYSLKSPQASCSLLEKELRIDGTTFSCLLDGQRQTFRTRLIGQYNIENMMAAVATVYWLAKCGTLAQSGVKFSLPDLAEVLQSVPPVPGRIEIVSAPGSDISVVVDYAHTPDGLEQVQKSLRPLCPGRLITIFGCGGDRDRGKRPLMARVVEELSDQAVVTSDNPRTEVPEKIVEDILQGFSQGYPHTVLVDRRKAIFQTISCAQPGDTILVAGKGHEDYQEVQGVKHPFLDARICQSALAERDAGAGKEFGTT